MAVRKGGLPPLNQNNQASLRRISQAPCAVVRIPVIVSSDSGANVSTVPVQREQRYGSS